MLLPLTVQQRQRRCGYGRRLAWWTLEHAMCCRCLRLPDDCRCRATTDPAEGCLGLDLEQVQISTPLAGADEHPLISGFSTPWMDGRLSTTPSQDPEDLEGLTAAEETEVELVAMARAARSPDP